MTDAWLRPIRDLEGEERERQHQLFGKNNFFYFLFLLSKSHFLSFIFFAQKPNLFNHHTLVSVVLKKGNCFFDWTAQDSFANSYDRMLILVFWCSLDNQAPVFLWFISLTKHITFVFNLIFKNKTKTRAQLATEINITYFWGNSHTGHMATTDWWQDSRKLVCLDRK